MSNLMEDEVRVLVVDDDADIALVFASFLSQDGYMVRVAPDGQGALAMAESFAPHCVLLDVNMPGIDGAELSRRFRALYGDDVVLIAITGSSSVDANVRETFDRVDHYLQKPFDLAALRKVLPPL